MKRVLPAASLEITHAFAPCGYFRTHVSCNNAGNLAPPSALVHREVFAQDNDRSMTLVFAIQTQSSESYCSSPIV